MSTGTSGHFGHLLQVSKKSSLKSDFMSAETPCHFSHLLLILNYRHWVVGLGDGAG